MMNHNTGRQDQNSTVAKGAEKPEINGQEGMKAEEKSGKLLVHHEKTQWVYWTIVLLGLWLVFSPLNFDYKSYYAPLPGGRTLWISEVARSDILIWSDIISGLLLVFLGYLALKPGRPAVLWMICFVGIWLNAAPLVFWAPSAQIYFTDTFVGILVISFSILIPGMPNMAAMMQMGPEIPPGWTYNPSSWAQRSILIFLGFAGFIVSRYLTSYQLGFTGQHIWEPFFGNGSVDVLTSKLSRSFPVSDAGVGTFAYTFEFLMGWMGGSARWRTMPWMVTLFGILVIPLGLTHIFLVISQPVTVASWCSMCLLAALCMLPMIPLEADEVFAMIQFLIISRKKGRPLWQTFWKGGTLDSGSEDKISPAPITFSDHPLKTLKAAFWGIGFSPWLIVSSALGVLVMTVPGILGSINTVSDIEHLAGALIVTTSVLAMCEAVRSVRFLNILLGTAVLAAPFFSASSSMQRIIVDIFAGLFVVFLCLPRGKIKENYGSWDKYIK